MASGKYKFRVLNVGVEVLSMLQNMDGSKLSRDERGILRDNLDNELYQLLVNRGSDGYYLSSVFRVFDELGLIEA